MNQDWVSELYRCYITQYMLHTKLNFYNWWFILFIHAAGMYQFYSVEMNFEVLELCIVLIKLWFDNLWVYLSVFVWYGDTNAEIWTG